MRSYFVWRYTAAGWRSLPSLRSRWALYAVVLVVMFVWLAWRRISLGQSPKRAAHMAGYLQQWQLEAAGIDTNQPLPRQITDAFHKADRDVNFLLSLTELADWLQLKTAEHVTMAIKNNIKEFVSLDISPRNGWVEWSEFSARFLRQCGVTYESQLSRKQKEQLMLFKAEFSEAAMSSPSISSSESLRLSVDSLLRFQHAEASHTLLLEQLSELVDTLDVDGDELLSLQEWRHLADRSFQPSADLQAALSPLQWPRLQQLHRQLDSDGDNALGRTELLVFLDVRHPSHATKLSQRLMAIADTNSDGQVSLAEALSHAEQLACLADVAELLHAPMD